MAVKGRVLVLVCACALGFGAVVLILALADRVRVEERLDARDEQLSKVDRRLHGLVAGLRENQRELRAAVRRLERLEHPTRLDLQRLFRGLLEAASPQDVRRLVRRLRQLGIVLPGRGDAERGQPGPPPTGQQRPSP